MIVCKCGEVIYKFQDKDFVICPKCNEVIFNEINRCEKYGGISHREKDENSMGIS